MAVLFSARKERELALRLLAHLRGLDVEKLNSVERKENAEMIRDLELTLGLVDRPGAMTLAKAVADGFLVEKPGANVFECTHPFTLETSDDLRSIVVVRIGTHPIFVHWAGPSEVYANQIVEINDL